MTEQQQQQKLQVCENDWVRRITRTKSVDRRRKSDLRKEVNWHAMQPNRKIGEKHDEMGRPLGKNGCKQTCKESTGEKWTQEKGKSTAEMGGLRGEGHEKIGGG